VGGGVVKPDTTNTAVTAMDLGGNHLRIGNEGARALADGLRKNTTQKLWPGLQQADFTISFTPFTW
jgi:hypothetical protein